MVFFCEKHTSQEFLKKILCDFGAEFSIYFKLLMLRKVIAKASVSETKKIS